MALLYVGDRERLFFYAPHGTVLLSFPIFLRAASEVFFKHPVQIAAAGKAGFHTDVEKA